MPHCGYTPSSAGSKIEQKSGGMVGKIIFAALVVALLCGVGVFLYNRPGDAKAVDTDSVDYADTSDSQSSSTASDEAEATPVKEDFAGLEAIHLIKHADSSQPPFNPVVINNNWKSQLLSLGFVQGDVKESAFKGDDKEASLYGDYEITQSAESFILNIPDDHIEVIHKTDYEETFEIELGNSSTLERFIQSLRDFGYTESDQPLATGGRWFDKVNGDPCPGIEWNIRGNKAYSINTDC